MKAGELREFIIKNAFITLEERCDSWRNVVKQEVKVLYKGKFYVVKREVIYELDDDIINKLVEIIEEDDERG